MGATPVDDIDARIAELERALAAVGFQSTGLLTFAEAKARQDAIAAMTRELEELTARRLRGAVGTIAITDWRLGSDL